MEPERVTNPELEKVLAELMEREPIFHRPELGTTQTDFINMTLPQFWEIGASGRRYSREYILEMLAKRHAEPHDDVWEAMDFRCQQLAENCYLLTYTLLQNNERLTRRTTIWQRTPAGWRIAFHQGTIVMQDQNPTS